MPFDNIGDVGAMFRQAMAPQQPQGEASLADLMDMAKQQGKKGTPPKPLPAVDAMPPGMTNWNQVLAGMNPQQPPVGGGNFGTAGGPPPALPPEMASPNGMTMQSMTDSATGLKFLRGAGGEWYSGGADQNASRGMNFDQAQQALGGRLPAQPGTYQSILGNYPAAWQKNPDIIARAMEQFNAQGRQTVAEQQLRLEQQRIGLEERKINLLDDPVARKRDYLLGLQKGSPMMTPEELAIKAREYDTIYGLVPGGHAAGLPAPGTSDMRGVPNMPMTPAGGMGNLPLAAPGGGNLPLPAPSSAAGQQLPGAVGQVQNTDVARGVPGETASQRAVRLQTLLGPVMYAGLMNRTTTGTNAVGGDWATSAKDLLTELYRQNLANPGYAERVGPALMPELERLRPGEIGSFMNPGPLQTRIENVGGWGGNYSDTAKARSAVRDYMNYGAPASVGYRYIVNPALRYWTGVVDPLDPNFGSPPVPGSPRAKKMMEDIKQRQMQQFNQAK